MKNIKNIIFDFDGVILDSVDLKNQAFEKIVENYNPNIKKKFINFHLKNLGISRKIKLKFLEKLLVKNQLVYNDKISKNFDKIMNNKLKKATLIPGVRSFIVRHKNLNLFISSGTPERDLKKKCIEKKISKYFKKIMGTPRSKNQHILSIKKKYNLSKKIQFYLVIQSQI